MPGRRIGRVDHTVEIREKSFLLDNSLEAFSALTRFLGSSNEMDSLRGGKRCMWPKIGRFGAYGDWATTQKRDEVMERETGIEPATSGLGSRRSTAELLPPSDLILQL